MRTTFQRRTCIFAFLALLLAVGMMSPAVKAEVVCDSDFTMVDGESGPVDFTCVTAFALISNSAVNVLDGAEVGTLLGGGTSVIGIYGGVVTESVNYETTVAVTVYAATVDPVDITGLDVSETEIYNSGSSVAHFTLTGTYLDGTEFALPFDLERGASIGLNVVQLDPDIQVLPASGTHDFGEINIGESAVYDVQIQNVGTADLTVTGLSLDAAGSADFAITGDITLPLVIAPDDSVLVPVEITFAPTVEGAVSTVLYIDSDDEDEATTEITLTGEGVVPPAPEIVVYPESQEHDFGDVEIGVTETYVVQILNIGDADLTVSELALDPAGSTDFSIASAPEVPFTVSPSETITVDIEIAYTPASQGYASTILTIGSDDEDEPIVEVAFGGVGIVVEIPPEQQIQDILNFIDESVANGTLIPYGPGNHPERRLCALKSMIRSAGSLIEAGYPEWAACILKAVDKKTDGERRPPDFVVGEATAALNQMVNDLIDDLLDD